MGQHIDIRELRRIIQVNRKYKHKNKFRKKKIRLKNLKLYRRNEK